MKPKPKLTRTRLLTLGFSLHFVVAKVRFFVKTSTESVVPPKHLKFNGHGALLQYIMRES